MKRLRLYYSAMRALLVGVLATSGGVQAQQSSIELSPEDALWLDVKAEDTVQAYQSYLHSYPVGRFASEAFRRVVEESRLGTSGSSDQVPEPAAGPDAASLLALADLY